MKNFMAILFVWIMFMRCSPGLNDSVIISEVKSFLSNKAEVNGLKFSEYFETTSLDIIDKHIHNKEAIVICNVNVKVVRWYETGSRAAYSFDIFFGNITAMVGMEHQAKIKFRFLKYEKGWRIEGFCLE